MKVLLVEDCQQVAEVIFDYFEETDYELDYAATGTAGLQLAQSHAFDCIVLDIMLPGLDGISLCKQLRAEGNDTPVIMLTARDTDDDMLTGLRTGADDYIVKPFNMALLEARIESLTRRHSGKGFSTELTCGAIRLDLNTHQVFRDDKAIKLTPVGFKILHLLMVKSPAMVSRQEIEHMLWPDELPDQDILRKHVYQLRNKIDKPFKQNMIQTVHKSGYKLVADSE